MSQQAQLIWMRNLLEHAIEFQQNWHDAGRDPYWAEMVGRDLACIRELCGNLTEQSAE